jgi:hypothetical protein
MMNKIIFCVVAFHDGSVMHVATETKAHRPLMPSELAVAMSASFGRADTRCLTDQAIQKKAGLM